GVPLGGGWSQPVPAGGRATALPATAQASSLSETSPEMPTAPMTAPPAPSRISTPPGAGTTRPSDMALAAAHPERAPRLARGDLRPDDAGAVLAGERLQMSAGVQDRDRQRRAAGLTALPERGFDDRGGLREAQIGHGRSSEFGMPSIVWRAV